MVMHEKGKNIKIIDEFLMYLIDKGYTKINIDFNYELNPTQFVIKVYEPKEDLLSCLQDEIYVDRDEELEEYGWELMGVCDFSNELSQLGMLVDKVEYVVHKEYLEIKLYREKNG